jgi:excisionase family DNA binding protein
MEEPSAPYREENISIMTVRDVASYLRLSEAKVYRLAKEGSVPSFRLGKSWRFRGDLIDEWTKKKPGKSPEIPVSHYCITARYLLQNLRSPM